MAQHDRNLLKKSDITRFQQWLDGNEWRAAKGDYQLMQIKLKKGWGAICIDAAGVITTPQEIAELIKLFKSGKPRHAHPEVPPPAPPRKIAEKQFIDDLRDDFAMAALQGILAGAGTEDAQSEIALQAECAGVELCDYLAVMSYNMADAMLTQRAKRRS